MDPNPYNSTADKNNKPLYAVRNPSNYVSNPHRHKSKWIKNWNSSKDQYQGSAHLPLI
jgi:hypothetical protein